MSSTSNNHVNDAIDITKSHDHPEYDGQLKTNRNLLKYIILAG